MHMRHHLPRAAPFSLASMIAFIMLFQQAAAIGISPGRIELDFVPGQSSLYGIYVVGGSFGNIAVSSRPSEDCGLSAYITPEKTQLFLQPGEKAYIYVNVSLPADYPRPGVHYCSIIAEEVPETGSPGLAAFSAVQAQIWIRVPYQARYLDGSLSVQNVNLSGTARFYISLESLGLEDVTANGAITVTDSDGRVVATLQTASAFIESMQKGALEASWDTAGMPAGRYHAAAVVEYGAEKPLTLSSDFKIGDILVRIINVTYPEDIYPDEITRLDVLVDSYWNGRIEGSYMTLSLENEGRTVDAGRSESFDLEPWEGRLVPIYWDTDGLSEGTYPATLQVHYAGRTESRAMQLTIKPRQDPYLFLLLVLIAAAIAAAAAYAAWRRRRRGRAAGNAGKSKA